MPIIILPKIMKEEQVKVVSKIRFNMFKSNKLGNKGKILRRRRQSILNDVQNIISLSITKKYFKIVAINLKKCKYYH